MALKTDPAGAPDPAGPRDGSFPDSTGADVLLDYVRQQSEELQRQVPGIRANDPEAVHTMRTSVRRIRSVLATARKLFDAESVNALRSELQWFGGVLGQARDPQVMHERLTDLLSEEPEKLVPGDPAPRLDQELGSSLSAGREEVLQAVDSARYSQLLDALNRMTDAPLLTEKAEAPPGKTMRKLVAKESKRLHRKVEALKASALGGEERNTDGQQDGPVSGDADAQQNGPEDAAAQQNGPEDAAAQRDRQLHDVRKAAKRLRYAAEAARPVLGKQAKRLEKSAHGIQKILGLHQDSVVARVQLEELGARASRTGEDGFTYGRLHAKEEARAAAAEAEFNKAWKKFRRRPA
jgi:CHAD domain-containing protein